MSASKVKAGQVYVEIGADPRAFFSALNKINRQIGNLGRSMSGAGRKVAGMGAAALLPFGAAISQGAAYQSTLLNIQASTGATAAELDKIRAAGMQVSQALGVGPTEATHGFLELLKAGMSLEQVLGGAGQTALEFAKVGNMDVAAASVVMADAMKVFGVSADVAANTMSSAADASSTSIEEMTMAFSQSAAVAALANQSMGDLSAALAVLANNGVKGSDAGTSVKTMLMRLMAPADDAAVALEQVGLSVMSFRGADGQMKPMVEIIGTLNSALAGMDQAAKDDIFRRIFGQDAIRAAAILTATGVDGFEGMREAMRSALPVGEKYKILMSGLAGSAGAAIAALQRLAIEIADAVTPALAIAGPAITGFINGLAKLSSENKKAVAMFATVAAAAIGVGGAMTGLGISLQIASFGFSGIGKATAFALSPLTMLMGTVTGVGKSFALAMPATLQLANSIGSSMLGASASVLSFAATAGGAMAQYAANIYMAAAATVANAARMGAAWVASALPGVVAFASAAAGVLAKYVGSTVMSAAASVTNAVRSGAAWVASALPGVVAFVGGAVAGIGTYLGAAAMAVAGSVASAAAVAAAWVAPLAPLLLLSAAAVGVVVAFKQFGPQIAGAFSGVAGYASDAAGAIGDLAKTATTTFNGVYEAVAAGDLSGAMDVLWAGLVAGWLRGVEVIMGAVDPWVSAFQNVFTDLGHYIYIAWDLMWTDIAALTRTMGAAIYGAFESLVNPILQRWDDLTTALKTEWINLKALFTASGSARQKLADEKNKLQEDAAARRKARESGTGVAARMAEAATTNAEEEAKRKKRKAAIYQSADDIKAEREGENQRRADQRRADTQAAEGAVAGKSRGKREARAQNQQFTDLLKSIEGVSSLSALRDLYDEFDTLSQNGRLTSSQASALETALEDAQERVSKSSSGGGGASPSQQIAAGAGAAGTDAATSKAEVAGTFSSVNLGGMGFGSSLGERQLKALETIASNTANMDGPAYAQE